MILRHLLLPDILDLVESGRLIDVREFLAMQPAPEIADLLTALDDAALESDREIVLPDLRDEFHFA